MTEPRSAELIKREMRALFEEYLRVNDEGIIKADTEEGGPEADVPMVLTKWALVGHQTGFDGEGKPWSGYPYIYSDDGLAPHDAYGLLLWHAEHIGMDSE